MKEKMNNIDMIEISVEQFDALTGEHEFSDEYKEKKSEMLSRYRKSVSRTVWNRWMKAAAVLLLILAMPVMISKAAENEFFNRIWGALGKENIESHEEVLYDEEKGTSATVTYPKREYTDNALDKAEELMGDAVSFEPVVKEIGDTRLTILASAYDGSAAVVEFTLEREGGVEGLCYGRLDNESKGAWFSEDAPFHFYFADCSENIYVDLERSTENILYCYDYMVMRLPNQTIQGLSMEIYYNTGGSEEAEAPADTLVVPIQKEIDRKEYRNADDGRVSLSPISMDVDMNKGLGLTADEACDPWNAYYIAVNYQDGSNYVVHEHEIQEIHSCEVEIENTSYVAGRMDGHLVMVFNRLVDMNEVESIMVNETIYTLK